VVGVLSLRELLRLLEELVAEEGGVVKEALRVAARRSVDKSRR
jgi:hypothetical protein